MPMDRAVMERALAADAVLAWTLLVLRVSEKAIRTSELVVFVVDFTHSVLAG